MYEVSFEGGRSLLQADVYPLATPARITNYELRCFHGLLLAECLTMLKEDLDDIFFNYDDEFDVSSRPHLGSVSALPGFTDAAQKRHEKDFHEVRSAPLRNNQLSSG
jgi:hypothetical protein